MQKLCNVVKRAEHLDYKAMLLFLVMEVTSSINWNDFDQTCHGLLYLSGVIMFMKTQASKRTGSR